MCMCGKWHMGICVYVYVVNGVCGVSKYEGFLCVGVCVSVSLYVLCVCVCVCVCVSTGNIDYIEMR